jgi:hypothetical protein
MVVAATTMATVCDGKGFSAYDDNPSLIEKHFSRNKN